MRNLILFFNKYYLFFKYGRQLKTVGNAKIGNNFSLIVSNKKCEVILGSNVNIGANVVFHCDGRKIVIGDDTVIDHNTVLRLWDGEIIIGKNVYINSGSVLNGHGSLQIGNDCLLGMQVAIIPSNHNTKNVGENINKQGIEILPVIIENNVWIGSGAKILAGVRLCSGSVIGSNAVVKDSVESNTIAVGVPAKKRIKR